VAPGQRVRVPFRGRPRPAIVVAVEHGAGEGLETIAGLLDPVPALTPPLLELLRWAAAETVSAWGEAAFRALPPGTRARAPETLPPLPSPIARPASAATLATGPARDARAEQRVAEARSGGAAVLVVAPEIEQAGAWAARLETRLGEPVRLVTSAAPPGRRWAAWWACRSGQAPVAVGTRAAVWLPLAPVGLTVVLDEEDPAHKSPDAPRWHARDLALERARREGGASLLTSAAPSLESWVGARTGALATEPEGPRPPRPPRPIVECVALGGDRATEASLSPGLRDSAREALGRGRSVLLVLNRLGFARTLVCAECGAVRRCARCRLALLYHRETRALACRLCGVERPAASLCGRCRGRRLQAIGWGTERLEAEARRAFPEARVVRYDSTVGPDDADLARSAFRSGAAQILVGTSMALRLAEEAPVAVAALVLADATLNLPDFRAAERTFQLAWRLSESVEPGGSLWLQSFLPEHPALVAVARGEPERFYEPEWRDRQELGYPPARRMARLVAEGRDALRLVEDLAARGRAGGATVLGPAMLAGARAQVVLLGGPELPAAVAAILDPLRGRRRLGGTRLAIDMDPVELP
jgi:primosomal protein N' (replication factor Y) (superfamily II helicase)